MSRLCKKMYAVQPYQVGPKNKKSLAVVIPSRLAKEFGVDTSTIFASTDYRRSRGYAVCAQALITWR